MPPRNFEELRANLARTFLISDRRKMGRPVEGPPTPEEEKLLDEIIEWFKAGPHYGEVRHTSASARGRP